jgi:hypothetical protein
VDAALRRVLDRGVVARVARSARWPDIGFRWSFLAEQMLRHGSLDFYPPRSAEDFFTYFWVESIPPGVSALHAWSYACGGSFEASWTVPGTVLQLWALHELLWRTADRISGLDAARLTCIAAAACPLLTWSVFLAQETGLTALSMIGIAFGLASWRDTPTAGWAALIGGFAALGAAAREYGIVFPLLAAGGLVAARADRAAWVAFGGAALLSLVWPLRVWALMGNPFYSLAVGGLFPISAPFVARIDYDAAFYGAALQSISGWREVARYMLLFAPAALIGWFALVAASLRRGRTALLGLAAVLVLLALWATSVRYTNGGLFYSLRVMGPALALGALAVGVAISTIGTYRPRLAMPVNIALALFMITLLPATLALPLNPSRTPWREWPSFAPRTPDVRGQSDPLVALVSKAASATASAATDPRPAVVLADSPGHQRTFLPTGIRVIPLWSPQADWLFDLSLPPAEAIRRWRTSGVRFIIVAKWQANLDYFNQFSRWNRPPFRIQRVGETSLAMVFAIDTAD